METILTENYAEIFTNHVGRLVGNEQKGTGANIKV
jgi:hypothetical protein